MDIMSDDTNPTDDTTRQWVIAVMENRLATAEYLHPHLPTIPAPREPGIERAPDIISGEIR